MDLKKGVRIWATACVLAGLWILAAAAKVDNYTPAPGQPDNTAALYVAFGAVCVGFSFAGAVGATWIVSLHGRARAIRVAVAQEALQRLHQGGLSRVVTIADGVLDAFDLETRARVASFTGLLYERAPLGSGWWSPVGVGLSGRVWRPELQAEDERVRDLLQGVADLVPGEAPILEVLIEGTTLWLFAAARDNVLEIIGSHPAT